MKKLLLFIIIMSTITISVYGQAPQKIKYQAVVRDGANTVLNNQAVGMRLTVQQGSIGGTAVYTETFTTTTNAFGLVNLDIGTGTTTDDFTTIDWSAGSYFVEIAVDITGGVSYSVLGTSELLSVPYALYSETAENVINDLVDDADADATNELQTLSVSSTGDTLYLQNGGFVIIPGISVANPPPPDYPSGSIFCASGPTEIVDVTNPTTGEIWMDRNLGATQAATSSTDANSYGDLYQWGRFSDGHQCRTSATTATLSSIDQPAHGDFIIGAASDWRSPQNDNLWQGVNGVNNPCPSGYRIPTESEINAERLSWYANTSAGALASPLKLPMAGGHDSALGSLGAVGTDGYYWSSTVSSTFSRFLRFVSSNAGMYDVNRADGFSVRCLKD